MLQHHNRIGDMPLRCYGEPLDPVTANHVGQPKDYGAVSTILLLNCLACTNTLKLTGTIALTGT